MRNILGVREQILAAIPNEVERERLRQATASMADSVRFTAPEAMVERWRQFAYILGEQIGMPTPEEPWKQQVQNIFNGKEPSSEHQSKT